MPLAANVTVPLAPWLTAVTDGVFSKLSALAPLLPVMALKVIAVSSLVVTVSSTMSATASIVTLTVPVSMTPPEVTV